MKEMEEKESRARRTRRAARKAKKVNAAKQAKQDLLKLARREPGLNEHDPAELNKFAKKIGSPARFPCPETRHYDPYGRKKLTATT